MSGYASFAEHANAVGRKRAEGRTRISVSGRKVQVRARTLSLPGADRDAVFNTDGVQVRREETATDNAQSVTYPEGEGLTGFTLALQE